MSEFAPGSFFNFMPARVERARVYIGDGMTEEGRDTSEGIAAEFQSHQRPIARTAVLIPVAANQDAKHIFPAMRQYAAQQNCDPFTVFLYLNTLMGEGEEAAIEKAEEEAIKAQVAFPNLDIRTAGCFYSESAPIGQKRRHLWDAVFMLAYAEGHFKDGLETIGLNHDIDTISISPHYISRVQKHYERQQARAWSVGLKDSIMPPVGTRVSHAVLPTHPNVARVTQWVDNSYFQRADHGSYEAGLVLPFSHYAQRGGFSIYAKTHETHRFAREHGYKHIIGAQLYTSPRRYIDRVLQHGTKNIWNTESFGPQDPCRDALRPDISKEQAEDIILERLHDDIKQFWLDDHMTDIYTDVEMASLEGLQSTAFAVSLQERLHVTTSRQLAKAERLLRFVVGSEILADMVRDSFKARAHAEATAKLMIDFNLSWLDEAVKVASETGISPDA